MARNLHKIDISNKLYGELDGVTVFLTNELYERLEKIPSKQGTLLNAFRIGRALQGQKHIITLIKASNKNSKIIFNLQKTEKIDNEYYISYEDYSGKNRPRFIQFYKETALDAARFYLNSYFPEEFEYSVGELKESEIKRVGRQLPQVLSVVSDSDKNKVAIMEEATKTVAKLKQRTRKLKTLKKALVDLQRQSSLSFYQHALDELRLRLTENHHETRGKDSWQKWVYENHWLLGVQYLTPIEKAKVGFDNIPDFVFPTLDGFIDILEIKRPTFATIREDPSHAGSFIWCSETNKAIGQVVNYLQIMELNQLQITKRINEDPENKYPTFIHSLKPRAFILIGNSSGWDTRQKQAFRILNYCLHGIEVLTYTDLISRGESIIKMLGKQ